MICAKVDSNGDVVKFPVYIRGLQPVLQNHVFVDTQSRFPNDLKWHEGAWWDGIERDGDKYIMNYRVGEKYAPNSIEKKEAFQRVFTEKRFVNQLLFDNEKITKEKFDSNNLKLDMTNPDDEETYELLNQLEF